MASGGRRGARTDSVPTSRGLRLCRRNANGIKSRLIGACGWRGAERSRPYAHPMSHKHDNLIRAIFHDPISGNLQWREVESLLRHLGAASSRCRERASA